MRWITLITLEIVGIALYTLLYYAFNNFIGVFLTSLLAFLIIFNLTLTILHITDKIDEGEI